MKANTLDKSRFYSSFVMFIDALATDGALCNAMAKDYDEQGTLEGGAGNRLMFTRLNDSISNYHNILKVLTGERRSNITEAVPVIDYLHLGNTSMMSTYEELSPGKINPRNIVALDDKATKTSVLLNENAPGLLNRLFMNDPGDLPAYFYNTMGQACPEPSIQVAGYTGKHAFIYKGVKSKTITDIEGQLHSSTRLQDILCLSVFSDTMIQLDPAEIPSFLQHSHDILSPESNCEGKGFVTRVTEDGKTWKVSLTADDFAVFIPAVTYCNDPSLLIIFKFNQDASDASSENYKGDNTYKVFVVATTTMVSSRSFQKVTLNSQLPEEFWKDYLIETLQDYIEIEEEFYSDASSLLNGGFDQPHSIDPVTSDVTLWKLLGDYKIAEKRGVIINKSSKYFSSHLLGRGVFYEDPLKLTKNDYTHNLDGTVNNNPDRDEKGDFLPPRVIPTPEHTPTVDPSGNPERYTGKATLMYDKLITKISELFGPVKRSDWKINIIKHPVRRLDSITKKLDYSTEQLSSATLEMVTGGVQDAKYPMKHPAKFDPKNNQSREVSYKEIQAYIDICTSAAGSGSGDRLSNGVLHLSTNSSEVCCKIGEVREKTWLFGNFPGNWFQDATVIRDDGELIYERMDKAFYLEYVRHYSKGYEWCFKAFHTMDDPCVGVRLKACSPLEAFSKVLPAQAQQNTILVYPEYNDLLPEELYLISRQDLGLEEYGRELSGRIAEGGMVSFYNSSQEKLISFKVAHKYAFLPSLIKKVEVYDAEKNITFTRDCEVEGGKDNDCYIYTLQPMELSLKDLVFYGQDDEPISLQAGKENISLVPLSYPSDYFLSEIVTSFSADEDNIKYVIDRNHRTSDLRILEDSLIIPDLPVFTDSNIDILDKTSIGHTTLNMHIFKQLIVEGIGGLARNIIRRSMYQILAKWKVTNSESNPIQLEDMPYFNSDQPGLANGLVSLSNALNNLKSDQLKFPINKTVKEIDADGKLQVRNVKEDVTEADLQPLLKRLKFDDSLVKYSFTVDGVDTTKDKSTVENSLNNILLPASVDTSQDIPVVQSLDSLVGLNVSQLRTTRYEVGQNKRPSIEKLSKVLQSVFSGKSVIERSDCVKLDSYLGTGAQAIIKYGDPTNIATPESLTDLNDVISQLITYVLVYCDNSIKSKQEVIDLDIYKSKQASLDKTISEEIEYQQDLFYKGDTSCLTAAGNAYSILEGKATLRKLAETAAVEIPASIDGAKVVSVDNLAIENNQDIESLTLPSSVTKIDSIAVTGCSRLTSIKVTSNVAYVGAYAFANCPSFTKLEIYVDNIPEAEADVQARIKEITKSWDANWKGLTPAELVISLTSIPPLDSSENSASSQHKDGLDELNNKVTEIANTNYEKFYNKKDGQIDFSSINLSVPEVIQTISSMKRRYRWLTGFKWKWKSDEEYISIYELGQRQFSESWRIITASIHNILENFLEKNVSNICNAAIETQSAPLKEAIAIKATEAPDSAQITSNITSAYASIVKETGLPERPVPYQRISEETANSWVVNHNPCLASFKDVSLGESSSKKVAAFAINFDLPAYDGFLTTSFLSSGKKLVITDSEVTIVDTNKPQPSKSPIRQPEAYQKDWVVDTESPDVSLEVLNGVAQFVKVNLEGVGSENSQIRFIKNDKKVTGRSNGLYYQRYNALNARLNKLKGTLNQAITFNKGPQISNKLDNLNTAFAEGYSNSIKAIPVKGVETLEYMPAQTASASQFAINGKFYYSAELSKMKEIIGDKCVLTCNSCTIKDTCPFYNEEEILKLYCTPCRSIDLWVKDNELDLLYYDESEADYSPKLEYTAEDGSSERLGHQMFKDAHLSFSDILKKTEGDNEPTSYIAKDLENLREQLAKQPALGYSRERDGLGWLLGARYGVVEKNNIKHLLEQNPAVKNTLHVPDYKFLYDAVYIADEESAVQYRPSTYRYDVSFEKKTSEGSKIYSGSTRIKIPATLKIFADGKPEDEVYLISDDKADSQGNPIQPIVYLGQLGQLKITFDLVDDGINNPVDQGKYNQPVIADKGARGNRIYAQDVAQACVNIAKGHLIESPLGENGDLNTGKDQYWMETMRKPFFDETKKLKWLDIPGRSRVLSGYQEPLMDKDHLDEGLILSGKRPVASYIDYVRRISIIMYTKDSALPGDGHWDIPWVNERFAGHDPTTLALLKEKQRKTLPLMKTNLRLVVLKVH